MSLLNLTEKVREIPGKEHAGRAVRCGLCLEPREISRFKTGLCHFVFAVETAAGQKVVVRIATRATQRLLEGGVYWNDLLRPIGVPLPRILATGIEPSEVQFPFVILEWLPGSDLCEIYRTLSSQQKLEIVGEVARIQEKVSFLTEAGGFGSAYSYSQPPEYRSWTVALLAILERAHRRMSQSAHPGSLYVGRAREILGRYEAYFTAVRPVPFLEDTTTKNVLVDQGRLSGVVDVDQLCFGDPLLTIGLTQMALLADRLDVNYVEYWMDLLKLSSHQRRIVAAYTLLFCVDFMSEHGRRFNKEKPPEIDLDKFARLESVFATLAG